MKVVFQIVRRGSLNREANPWFRPRESSGTGATGNGRVRSCRDNIARRSFAMPTSRDGRSGCQQQGGRGVRLEGMSNVSELGDASSLANEPKLLSGSAKRHAAKSFPAVLGMHGCRAAGVCPGTNPFLFETQNMVNPMASSNRGKLAARRADESAGKGSWRKQRPVCNGLDRSLVAPCESRPTSSRLCIARLLEEPRQEESK